MTRPPAARPTLLALLLAVLLPGLLMACTGRPPADTADPAVRVAAGSTTEQEVLAALAAEALRRDGHAVEVVGDLGGTDAVRDAALDGRVDVHWDYSGAAWSLGLHLTAPPVDPVQSFEAVAAEDAENGLRWLGPTDADARLTFFVTADATGGEDPTVSWLARAIGADGGALCADRGYLEAPAGLAYLADVYSMGEALETTVADEEEALALTADGGCLAGLAAATSGSAADLGLIALRDDQGVFPALAVAPVVRSGGRADDPAISDRLTALAEQVTTDRLRTLNADAAAGEPVEELAAGFLDGTAGQDEGG